PARAPRSAGGGGGAAVAPAGAQTGAPQPVRELVRIRGYNPPAPAGVDVSRELTLVVLGQQVRFAASEWRTFAFFDPTAMTPAPEPAQIMLQGERPLLHSITPALPARRVTLLPPHP